MLRLSSAFANMVSDRSSMRELAQGGRLLLFGSPQAATPDYAAPGVLLATVTQDALAFTPEVAPAWKLTLSDAAGSVDSIKVGGIELLSAAVPFSVDLATTATAVASAITAGYTIVDFTATANSADITITGPKEAGASLNTLTCAATTTTLVATAANGGAVFTAGSAAVNGLQFSYPAAGGAFTMSGTWAGVGVAKGVAASFRYCCNGADSGMNASTVFARFDGSVSATGGGGDLTINNASIEIGSAVRAISGVALGLSKGW